MTGARHDHSKWQAGPPADGDQLGAGRLLTPERRLAALRLVRHGALHDLGRVIDAGAPRMMPNHGPFVLSTYTTAPQTMRRRAALGAVNAAGSNNERIEMTAHVGTHIDALGHVTIGERMYGGRRAADVIGDFGLTALGIEQAPPIVARAVLLDLAGADGGEYLNGGRAIGADEIANALRRVDHAIEPGDVVLLRTGWGRYYQTDNDRYTGAEPGLDAGAARWLTAAGVVAIGADTMAVEVLPPVEPTTHMPVHQHCLVEAGVYLIENLWLDDLAAAGVSSFCFILLPVKFRGATGSPVTPIALL